MSWRVLTTASSDPDFQALTEKDRLAVVDDLFGWLVDGPPRSSPRLVGGAVLFDDVLACGFSVSYFVDEPDRYIAVLRLRRLR